MTPGPDILAWMQAQRDAMIALLADLVRAESPSAEPEAQAMAQKLLWEAFDGLGAQVEVVPGRQTGGYLVAQWPDATTPRPCQLLLGHCDTVWPLGTLQEMPFEVADGIVRGPGVYDMKGGLVQMVFALRALQELGLETAVSPVVLVNSDEEIGSPESRKAIERWARQAARAFVLEPALGPLGKLKTARKGVGKFEVVIRGRAAHAGLDPELGVSAVLALSHVIQQLSALNDWERGITVNVGLISGGLSANVIAPEARAQVDVRVPTLADAVEVEAAILALQPPLPETTVAVSGRFGRPPLEPTPANRRLWRAAQTAGQALGLSLQEGRAGGGSDGNLTSRFTATLDGLGAVGEGAHARHEGLFVERWLERAALLALLLLLPSGEGEPCHDTSLPP